VCVCKNLTELYDIQSDKFLDESIDPHKNQTFISHFNKQVFSDSLNKFINSPSLHISFAFFQFDVMKNIHAAVHELKIAQKKRPSIQQQFTIFRYQKIIEASIKKESRKYALIYE
jgi:hypothetical protein